MENWVSVFNTQKFHEAEIVKAVLEDNDIPTIVLNKKDSSYHFGAFEVHVKKDCVLRAIKIIQDDVRFG